MLSGPSQLLDLPDWIWILTLGIVMNWFFGSWLVVPVASEVIDCAGEKKKLEWAIALKQKNARMSSDQITKEIGRKFDLINDELTDKSSALMNMAYAGGCAIAPILGG